MPSSSETERPPGTNFILQRRSLLGLLLAALTLSAASAAGIIRLQPDARIDLLADQRSETFAEQVRFADAFGGDPVLVMVEPKKGAQLLSGDHLIGLARIEGELARSHGVKKVYGPGTLVNTLATDVTRIALDVCGKEGQDAETAARQRAAAAHKSAQEQDQAGQQAFEQAVRACAQRIAQQYPSLGVPALNNPVFFQQVLLEPGGQQVRPFWRWALPDTGHALITVRLTRQASLNDVERVLRRARSGAGEPGMSDLRFTVSGAPALTASLADSVFGSLTWLLPAALVIMLAIAFLAIGWRAALLIPVAGMAGFWTAGLGGWAGLPVTPATLAVLPVVLGLAADYLIQLANRIAEEEGTPTERVAGGVWRTLPALVTAGTATGAGMLAFAASSIPMVRQFGFFMALGVAMALAANLLVGLPALVLLTRSRRFSEITRKPLRGAGWMAGATRLPIALALALIIVGLAGWAALPGQKIETDPSRLMAAGDPALKQADQVRRATGIAGELDLVLAGPDTTRQGALQWLNQQASSAQGASAGDLRLQTSLPEFLAAFNSGTLPDAARTQLILERIPSYFSGAVVDSKHSLALDIFGITRLTSVDRDRSLVDLLNGLPPPPAGYRAYPAGLAVVASQALTALSRDALWLTALALALVGLTLLLASRRPLVAGLAVLPTLVAGGAATGLAFLAGAHASPITTLLGGVVIAFATEFSVLWLARYRWERRRGMTASDAAELASRRVGPAIAASALTLSCGFAVVGLSPVPAVRDFGIWSAIDMALATVAVLGLLPRLARSLVR